MAVIYTKGNDRTTSRSATVKCTNCRAQITNSGIRTSMEGVEKYSVDAWNRRENNTDPEFHAVAPFKISDPETEH